MSLAGIWFVTPRVLRQWQVWHLARLCAARRAIVLTYDDGPSGTTTGLLDLLALRGVRAGFFVIGNRAEARPELIARLLAEGHEICNHTQTHLNALKVWPLATVTDQRLGRQTLARLGVKPGPFRPPYGKTTLATLLDLWINGEKPFFWTIDTRDSWEKPRSVGEVLGMIRAQGGGVVLMHDFDSAPRGADGYRHSERVLQMTAAIIDFAAAENFKLLCIGELDPDHGRRRPRSIARE